MKEIKAFIVTAVSALMSFLGVLGVPILTLVACNVIDYVTGMIAAKYRDEPISSCKSVRGIIKKVCLWLLIIVGAMIDTLLDYASEYVGIAIPFTFVVAIIITVWLICNEIISILENMIDIGVSMPPFLMPLVKQIKKQVEDKAEIKEDE